MNKYISKILKSSLIKASSIYTLTSFFNALIPFILLPILTRYLTPEDYGIISMFGMLLTFIGVILGLNVHGAINRVFFEQNINFKEYIFNCLLILISTSFVSLILICIFINPISKLSSISNLWILIAVISSFFQFVYLSLLSIYRSQMQAKKFAFFQILQSLINSLLTIILIIIYKKGWNGRLISQSIAIIFTGIFSLYIIMKHWVKKTINLDYIKHSLKYSVPLIPQSLGGMLIMLPSRFIITNLIGLKATGIYTVGLQIGSIIGLFADAFNKAYSPWLFEKLNKSNKVIKLKIVKFTYLYIILILLFAIFLSIISPLIGKYFLGKSFNESTNIIFFIALGASFHGMYYMFVNYLFYVYKTNISAVITIVCGLLNIPTTYFFTKKFNIMGSAITYCLIYFIMFILTFLMSNKEYKMPWFWWKK